MQAIVQISRFRECGAGSLKSTETLLCEDVPCLLPRHRECKAGRIELTECEALAAGSRADDQAERLGGFSYPHSEAGYRIVGVVLLSFLGWGKAPTR